MTIRSIALAAAVTLTLAACSGTANITVPNATLNTSVAASGEVHDAFNTTDKSTQLQTVVGTDAVAYRATNNTQTNTWVIFYYSPSKNKSYQCTEINGSVNSVVEVTDTTMIYKPNYTIDKSKVSVDVTQAKTSAVAAATASVTTGNTGVSTGANAGVGVTTGGGGASAGATATVNANTFTNAELISPQQCQDETGKATSDPVYVVTSTDVTVNVKVYVSAKDGSVVTTVNANASASTSTTTTTGTATTAPSASPTMAPSTTPTMMPTTMPSTTVDTSASGTATTTTTTM